MILTILILADLLNLTALEKKITIRSICTNAYSKKKNNPNSHKNYLERGA